MRTWALALLVLVTGCPEQARPQQDPNVIALVNGEVIARKDFERELGRELTALEGRGAPTPEQVEPYKQALLDTVIERTLLLQAARQSGIEVTQEEVDRRVLALSSEYPAESFDAALTQSQTTRAELTRSTKARLLIEKLFERDVLARVAVPEDAIRRYYDEHPDEFQEAEQVHAMQIVVASPDDAKRIQGQLFAGKKFPDLARRYSLSADGKVGGDLGFFARGVMPPQFDEAVFKLGVGQVSDVVSTDYGFHVFKVVEKKPARKRELHEVRPGIEQKMLAQLREEGQKDYVKSLRAKAEIKVNDQVLLTVTSKPGPAAQEER
ncbi:MAG: peptidyl-prolyl cis-trans isomerase [Myxococcaceae bacterium]|nr:peptidyl-prolyl cis-trans isomerase [Myxococcaceae bacterium]